ncbi:co-chaperone GroES [Candidatus Phytoplasma melaleucae]|uniref:10 kDa chaperonin n=1 Tax=Candidatus Phytoplasma melaleucae TaxID=2982630 RepID=A0ABT9DE22_9MOLU|nr:co-chaperone GroES ['Melaleuca sp.' phytoplasma]MDO8168064.1 co-chaperone GroES ['Melaleuca sp.' phytoplasma]MDV3205345.1 co-chaperone GroES [Weeping tea tree witches'-broom phytoplasma]
MKIKPLNDYVVLIPKEKDNKIEDSPIYTSTEKQKQESVGVILDCGPSIKSLKKNDTVVYKNYSGNKINLDEQEYLIIKEEDIIALLENN